MAAMKQYFLSVLEGVSDDNFGQNAVEHAILTGKIELSYNLQQDVAAIMAQYDVLCEAYHRHLTLKSYEHIHITGDAHVSRPSHQRRKTVRNQRGRQLLVRTQS